MTDQVGNYSISDIQIGDMVKLNVSKHLPYWVNRQSLGGHLYFVASLHPLIVFISSTNMDKLCDKFPWNVEYKDRQRVIVKVDKPIRISIKDIREKIDFNKNIKLVTNVLDKYNEYIQQRGE